MGSLQELHVCAYTGSPQGMHTRVCAGSLQGLSLQELPGECVEDRVDEGELTLRIEDVKGGDVHEDRVLQLFKLTVGRHRSVARLAHRERAVVEPVAHKAPRVLGANDAVALPRERGAGPREAHLGPQRPPLLLPLNDALVLRLPPPLVGYAKRRVVPGAPLELEGLGPRVHPQVHPHPHLTCLLEARVPHHLEPLPCSHPTHF
mmetsp:Transcript_38651/g.96817  ORF Transcript_38651/g.96817 Transcript_38651/m.96817 type:complete len:204 (-) Transcript_38651:254-865(-)